MNSDIHSSSKSILLIFCVGVIFNLLILNIWMIMNFGRVKSESPKPKAVFTTLVPTAFKQGCPLSCSDIVNLATNSSNFKPSATPQPEKITTNNLITSQTKEYYFPLGSGFSKANDWTDVPGLQIYIDTSNYSKIKNAYFEASVYVPNGVEDVYVRLFNATDQHPVWFSDLFFASGSTTTYLVSEAITLDAGNKLYKVQMKTQLQATANLNQSRIHVTTY